MTLPTMSPLTGPFERREDGPWWARVTLWFLMHYGLPTLVAVALALLFVYLSVGDVKAIRLEVVGTKQALTTHNIQMVNDASVAKDLAEKQLRVMQAMCYNSAKDAAERGACAGR